MPDMLVPLYRLPDLPEGPEGIEMRPARPYEGHALLQFVATHFNDKWVSEVTVALAAQPAKVLVAIEDGKCLGFACYDITARGFFGPTGVDVAARGRGLGKLLLLGALHALKNDGFAYGVIGQAGPVEFYKTTCGATVIPDSEPGYYSNSFA